jgi:hypothetical protein
MATLRYSGEIRIRLTYIDPKPGDVYADGTFRNPHGKYRCYLSRENGANATIYVGAVLEHGSGIGVDSPEAFDSAAGAAISFAEDEESGWSDHAAYAEDGSGYCIARKPNASRAESHVV